MLSAADGDAARERDDRLHEMAELLERGELNRLPEVEPSPVLEAIRKAFNAVLSAVAELPKGALPPHAPATPDEKPVTAVSPLVRFAARGPTPGSARAGAADPRPDSQALEASIKAIEHLAGGRMIAARLAAKMAIAERDATLAATARVDPPTMPPEQLADRLRSILVRLRAIRIGDLRMPHEATPPGSSDHNDFARDASPRWRHPVCGLGRIGTVHPRSERCIRLANRPASAGARFGSSARPSRGHPGGAAYGRCPGYSRRRRLEPQHFSGAGAK